MLIANCTQYDLCITQDTVVLTDRAILFRVFQSPTSTFLHAFLRTHHSTLVRSLHHHHHHHHHHRLRPVVVFLHRTSTMIKSTSRPPKAKRHTESSRETILEVYFGHLVLVDEFVSEIQASAAKVS
jgi:hypothetical protein